MVYAEAQTIILTSRNIQHQNVQSSAQTGTKESDPWTTAAPEVTHTKSIAPTNKK